LSYNCHVNADKDFAQAVYWCHNPEAVFLGYPGRQTEVWQKELGEAEAEEKEACDPRQRML
jgi:hypothetical protein